MPNPLYTCILNTVLNLVWFYGISTIIGYLMSNSLYVCIRICIICKYIVDNILSQPELIFGTQLNVSKYSYVSQTIQLNISYLLPQLNDQTTISNYSIQHKSFLCSHFKCQTILFDTYIEPFQMLPLWTWEPWQWKGTPHSSKAPALLELRQ